MTAFGEKTLKKEEEDVRYSIHRLEPTIKKFLKIVDIDLERLQRHRMNIHRLTEQEEWEALDKEQINATRTVQQIKANLREIENARNKITVSDLPTFDQRVNETKLKASRAVQNFIAMTNDESDYQVSAENNSFCTFQAEASPESNSFSLPSSPCRSGEFSRTPLLSLDSQSGQDALEARHNPPDTINLQKELHVAPDNILAAASWEHLQESLIELNSMIQSFATSVKEQGEKIDRIEDNIELAHINVQEGTKKLGKAMAYKVGILPAAGAVLGGVVGGPIGLLVGAKIGAICALGGGMVAGFVGGTFLRRRQEKITNIELENLKDRRSTSLPDIAAFDKIS